MNNRMISFERQVSPIIVNAPLPPPLVSQPPLVSIAPGLFLQNKPWCNFCDDYHEEKSCEVMKASKERIFGKKQLEIVNNYAINSLDWVDEEKIHVLNN